MGISQDYYYIVITGLLFWQRNNPYFFDFAPCLFHDISLTTQMRLDNRLCDEYKTIVENETYTFFKVNHLFL